VKAFHRTDHAEAILEGGFRDGTGTYGTGIKFSGVWFSDRPLDVGQGAIGDTVLCLEIPDEVFAEYEWIEDGKPFRESLIPACVVNAIGRPAVDPDA
jgi:hypothetical protein